MNLSLSRLILFPILGFAHSASSIQGVADKVLPDDVAAESTRIVDALMEGDTAFFLERKADLLPPQQLAIVSDEAFEAALRQSFSSAESRTEVSRHLVGVKAIVSGSLSEGSAKTYETIYEIETDENYVLVSLRLAYREGTNDCCEIKLMEGFDFEKSPYRERQALLGNFMMAASLLFIGGLAAGGFIFARRRRRHHAGADL